MNAPHLTRRDFTAGLGGIVLAFSLAPLAVTQTAAAAPGQPQQQPAAERLDRDQRRRHRHRLHRQGGTGAGHPHRACRRSRPRNSICRWRGSRSFPATPDARRTKARPPAACRSKTAEPRCASRARKCARSCIDLAAKKLGVAADSLKVADGTITAPDGRKVTYGELAGEADLKREATGKVRPKPAAAASSGRASRCRASTCRPRSRAAPPSCRTCGCRAWLHGRIARPPQYGAQLEAFDEAKVRAMPGVVAVVRDGSFLGVVAEREEQAIKAVEALSASAKWKAGTAAARSGAALRAAEGVADAGHRHQQQGGAAAGVRRQGRRGDLSPAVPGARFAWARPARSRSCGTASSPSGRTARASTRCAARSPARSA